MRAFPHPFFYKMVLKLQDSLFLTLSPQDVWALWRHDETFLAHIISILFTNYLPVQSEHYQAGMTDWLTDWPTNRPTDLKKDYCSQKFSCIDETDVIYEERFETSVFVRRLQAESLHLRMDNIIISAHKPWIFYPAF